MRGRGAACVERTAEEGKERSEWERGGGGGSGRLFIDAGESAVIVRDGGIEHLFVMLARAPVACVQRVQLRYRVTCKPPPAIFASILLQVSARENARESECPRMGGQGVDGGGSHDVML